MGAIKDIHELTAGLINSVKDRRVVTDLYKILDAISSFQSEHFEARERNVNLLADNCRLQQEIRDLQSNHAAAIRDLTDSPTKAVESLSKAHAAEIQRLTDSHVNSVASLKKSHIEEVARLNRRILDLLPKQIKDTAVRLLRNGPLIQLPSGGARTQQP